MTLSSQSYWQSVIRNYSINPCSRSRSVQFVYTSVCKLWAPLWHEQLTRWQTCRNFHPVLCIWFRRLTINFGHRHSQKVCVTSTLLGPFIQDITLPFQCDGQLYQLLQFFRFTATMSFPCVAWSMISASLWIGFGFHWCYKECLYTLLYAGDSCHETGTGIWTAVARSCKWLSSAWTTVTLFSQIILASTIHNMIMVFVFFAQLQLQSTHTGCTGSWKLSVALRLSVSEIRTG